MTTQKQLVKAYRLMQERIDMTREAIDGLPRKRSWRQSEKVMSHMKWSENIATYLSIQTLLLEKMDAQSKTSVGVDEHA